MCDRNMPNEQSPTDISHSLTRFRTVVALLINTPPQEQATLPFYLCMIITLLLVSFWPDVSLIIPKVLGGYKPAAGWIGQALSFIR